MRISFIVTNDQGRVPIRVGRVVNYSWGEDGVLSLIRKDISFSSDMKPTDLKWEEIYRGVLEQPQEVIG